MSPTKQQNKIVRTPAFAGGGITPEEKLQMDAVAQKWTDNAMRTDRIDPAKIVPAIKALYAAAGKKEPRVVIAPSPLVMATAYGFAAAIWYARKNPQWGTSIFDVSAATRAATYDATDAATRAATDDATYAATRDATRAATCAATDDATDAATRAATCAATYDATDAATYDATELPNGWARGIAAQLAPGNPNLQNLMLSCVPRWWNSYQGGNMWSAWAGYLAAARDVLGLRLPQHEKYQAWEDCALAGGFRVLHEEFCIVSDFPAVLTKDDQNRPHNDTGPSHLWRDGWALWFIHGVRVNRQIVEAPETLTVKQIEDERNAEVRRVMMERFGIDRFIKESGATVLHQDVDPMNGDQRTLYRKEVADDEPIVMVAVKNSTPEPDGSIKDYFIRVPPEIKTAGEAVAWTFGLAEAAYRPLVQT